MATIKEVQESVNKKKEIVEEKIRQLEGIAIRSDEEEKELKKLKRRLRTINKCEEDNKRLAK